VPYPGQTPTSGLPIPGGTATATPPLPPIPFLREARIGPVGDGWAVVDQAPPTVPPTVGPPPTGLPPIATPTSAAPGPSPTTDPNAPPPPPTTSSSRDLHGTWINLSGWRITSTFAVTASPADEMYPSLGYVRRADGDEYVLAWLEVTGTSSAIKAMRLDGWGFFFVPSATFSVASGGDVGRPSVAGEANEGDWFVVWAETAKDDPSRDIYGRRMNSNGVPYGAPRVVAGGASDQAYPSIGSLGAAGGYILAWENREQGMPPDIRVRRLNRSGVPYMLESVLAGGAAFSFAPNIASSDAETTLVDWLDRNAAGDNSILCAVVSRDGRRRGAERVIVQGGTGPAAVTPVVPPPGLPTVPVPLPPVPTAPGPVPPGPPVLPTP
jgi:hypothetical protein